MQGLLPSFHPPLWRHDAANHVVAWGCVVAALAATEGTSQQPRPSKRTRSASGCSTELKTSAPAPPPALNRVTELTTPDQSVTLPQYNEANLLDSVDVRVCGSGELQPRHHQARMDSGLP